MTQLSCSYKSVAGLHRACPSAALDKKYLIYKFSSYNVNVINVNSI
jgi:hypothetical protein